MIEAAENAKQILIGEIEKLLSNLDQKKLTDQTGDWLLQNNLVRFRDCILGASSRQEIENATKIFSRFCVDSMDWDAEVYKSCSNITQLGHRAGKA